MGHGSSTAANAVEDTFKLKSGIKGGSADENLAAMHVQSWCRRKLSKRRKSNKLAWRLYTEMEYQNESDFLKLHNLFTNLEALQECLERNSGLPKDSVYDAANETVTKVEKTPISRMRAGSMGLDPVSFTKDEVLAVMERMQRGTLLPFQVFMSLVVRAYKLQLTFPNVRDMDITEKGTVVVVGDLHGQFSDLLLIFEKSGLPSDKNPYVFNGDFVDRGEQGVEICSVLIMFQLLYPKSVFINRGNHEDFLVNKQFGFEAEVFKKYGPKEAPPSKTTDEGATPTPPSPASGSKRKTSAEECSKLMRIIACWFSSLPLGTLISHASCKKRVCVLHGGISKSVTIPKLQAIDRSKFGSIMHTALVLNGTEKLPTEFDFDGASTIVGCTWSDPQKKEGSKFNQRRGCGVCFGPDVTAKFLSDHKLKYLVRSHECVEDGYYVTHNGKLITVFSASDYYSPGSNQGAFLRFDSKLEPHYFQFAGFSARKSLPSTTLVERAALGEVFETIVKREDELRAAFLKEDTDQSGVVDISTWCRIMADATGLEDIPWMTIRSSLVDLDDAGRARYETTLNRHEPASTKVRTDSVASSLYKNLDALEYIFRLIDKDGSGSIEIEEFVEAATLLGTYTGKTMSPAEARRMANAIDLDHNGEIDLNEFVESFRIVEKRASSARGEASKTAAK